MSTPAKTGSARPDENGVKSGFNPSDTETNMGGPDATESVAAGGDQDADGEDEGQDAGEEGGSANTNVLEYLKRNTHMKAVDMFEKKRLEEQQASAGVAGGSGNTTDVSSVRPLVDQASRSTVPKPSGTTINPSSATSATQQSRSQLPAPDEGLPAKDLIKRNLPQAQASSASTSAYYLTPDFLAQAEDVINRQKASAQANAAATNASIGKALASDQTAAQGVATPNVLLDTTDRVMGYLKLREWVEAGLEGWKPELREILYPVFVHTFLDLLDSDLGQTAKDFFNRSAAYHDVLHHADLIQLKNVSSSAHLLVNPLVVRFRRNKYTVNLSRGSFGLLIGWLSDLGLEAIWDVSKDASRYKEAVRTIINQRLKLKVSESSTPLSVAAIKENGFVELIIPAPPPAGPDQVRLASAPSADAFNRINKDLALGTNVKSEKLQEHVDFELKQIEREGKVPGAEEDVEEDDTQKKAEATTEDGDVEMRDAASTPPTESTRKSGKANEKPASSKETKDETTDEDGLIQPQYKNLVGPTTGGMFSPIDVQKELRAVVDRRKRIKLGSAADTGDDYGVSGFAKPSLPSVCAYTVFDNGEGTTSTAISQDATYLAAGSAESCIRLWNLRGKGLPSKIPRRDSSDENKINGHAERDASAPTTRKLIGHSGPVYSLSFDPLGGSVAPPQHLLSSSQDGTVRLWGLETYKNLVVYKGHTDPVWAVEWGPLGAYFATASRDRTARLWVTDRVTPLRMFAGHLSDVDCLKFHPNSLYLATGSSDKTCRLWDVQRGECVRVFLGHNDAVDCLAISPNGRYLASASQDLTIKLWDMLHGQEIKTMTGHTQPITSLSFSAESSTLVSGGLDCTVRVWDVKTSGGPKKAVANVASTLLSGDEVQESVDLLTTYRTKRTPITTTHFTPRNLCLVAGTYQED
ncbi:hypothetical protein NliqN6_1604 [Naganishia liquefaciens]|uniref:TFIID subunit TAF5 NTD2 domain-containing protein n=1 Tax=Naganishia liquefaciens TaxID=104408 RepID=A0A8H3TQ72_9TREE|nr:hypothetical protein NliqN6_1604 [Naganishia liquefaciens]